MTWSATGAMPTNSTNEESAKDFRENSGYKINTAMIPHTNKNYLYKTNKNITLTCIKNKNLEIKLKNYLEINLNKR